MVATKMKNNGLPEGYLPTIQLDGGYEPSDKEEYMNGKHREYFRQVLVKWKMELLGESNETIQHLKENNESEPDVNDRATIESETSFELRTRDRYRKLLNKIESALVRVDSDEFGYCEETGDPIGIKRLQARPIATLSIEAQERHESYERTHVNEDDDDRF
jgi:DnaK suppressor protein